MKNQTRKFILASFVFATTLAAFYAAQLSTCFAQGTAFTYQGQLNVNGNPASGIYDLRFTISDALTGGSVIAGPVTNSATAVSNGLFAVTLDFGAGVFTGPARWVELGVSTNAALTPFTPLSPRQMITAAPYAMLSSNFSGHVSGDVSGVQGAMVVTSVGGQSAASVVSGAGAANAATDANTAGAIVKRDASGNFSAGAITAGTISGNGSGLNSLNASQLTGGNVADARLSANVALLNTNQVFTGSNNFGGVTIATNQSNVLKGTFTGNVTGNVTGNLSGNVTGNVSGSAASFTGSLAGDVTGAQSATAVSSVGGQSAANVASGVSAANAASSANTASAIVKRDASGNFAAGTVTGNLSGNATTATTANNFSGSLSGDVTGTQGATIVSSVGGQSAANVAGGANAANAATSANAPNTIVKRDGLGNLAAGAITAVSFGGNGSNVTNLNGANLIGGSVAAAKLGTGAALTNLQASGYSAIPSGGMVLSSNYTDANLAVAGFVKFGTVGIGDVWHPRPNAPVPERSAVTVVWTGSEMIIWGGFNNGPLGDGARYNPVLNSWSTLSTNGAPAARKGHSAVWTGSEMIIWGGDNGTTYFNDGARYNPLTDSWTPINTTGAPSARTVHTVIWTGTEMIVWGGYDGSNLNDGGRYNPATNGWAAVNTTGAPAVRRSHRAVWTGTEMIVWGGYNGTQLGDGGRYNPATNGWSSVSASGAPNGRSDPCAVWTGSEMIIWGGFGSANATVNDGARYNPVTDGWTAVSTFNAPTPRELATAVWTGSQMIVWGGQQNPPVMVLNDGGCYDPSQNRWLTVATDGSPLPRILNSAVWTGTDMLIFCGRNLSGTSFNDNFSYSPQRILFLYVRP